MAAKFKQILFFVFLPVLILLGINQLSGNCIPALKYFLAAVPILIVLIIMIVFHVGGQIAGPIGLAFGILIAFQCFGLSPQVLFVSQTKGFYLSLFVLAVFWPALFLYNTVNKAKGIQAIARTLECWIKDRGILLITIAWAFSGMLEGLAGFGIPVAIISPMLVELGLSPILAVATVAVGHAWSVTFGDMGVVFQTLISVVDVNPSELAMYAAILLGLACLVSGLMVAHLLKKLNKWPMIVIVSIVMALVQYLFVEINLTALASFCAGLSGVATAVLISKLIQKIRHEENTSAQWTTPLKTAIVSYGSLTLLMSIIAIVPSINQFLAGYTWHVAYPEVITLNGFVTPAVADQVYHPLTHPGTSILFITLVSYFLNKKMGLYEDINLGGIFKTTWLASWPAVIGIFSMVGLSALMEHTGMTQALAQVLSQFFDAAFPLVSTYIGMLGAFATGSNNNSNVLFGPLQEGIALLLNLSPAVIVAAQTTGGALGSMIAPAKVIVGCSTVNLQGKDGQVLRKTLPYGLIIGLIMGVATLVISLYK